MTRIERENKTVGKMIRLYCRWTHHYDGSELCQECRNLADYAGKKLEKCMFGEKKGSCRKCAVHCYEPYYRDRIKNVMRYSGPRMIFRHPICAVRHLWDETFRAKSKAHSRTKF